MTTFPSALLYSIGLHGSFAQGVVNPARWDPANATTMRGSGTTRLLAVDSQSGGADCDRARGKGLVLVSWSI